MAGQDILRVYADTSVFGGVFDVEFARGSALFLRAADAGRFHLVISPTVEDELRAAPVKVRAEAAGWLIRAEIAPVTMDAVMLQEAYLAAGVVTPASEADALHVAIATASSCDIIVSWNFRHIVNFRRIPLYNAVNALQGYRAIAIHSPLEVLEEGEDQTV